MLHITVLVAATLSKIEAGPVKKGKDGLKQNAREYKDMADYMAHFEEIEYKDSFSPSTDSIKQLKELYSEVNKPTSMKKTVTDDFLRQVRGRCDKALALIHDEYLMNNVEREIDLTMRFVRKSMYIIPDVYRPNGGGVVEKCEKVFVENLASALQRQEISRAIDLKAFYITLQKYYTGIQDAIIEMKFIKTPQGYQKMIDNVNAAIKQDPEVKDVQDVSFNLKEMGDTLVKLANLMQNQTC